MADSPALLAARTKVRDLSKKALDALNDPRSTTAQKKTVLDQVEPELKTWTEEVQTLTRFEETKTAIGLHGLDALGGSGDGGLSLGAKGPRSTLVSALEAKGYVRINPPRLEAMRDQQAQAMFAALKSGQGFKVEVKDVSGATSSTNVEETSIPDAKPLPWVVRREPTRVMSLIPSMATNSRIVEWFLQTTAATGAGPVPEGGLKPNSSVAYAARLAYMTKIAHVTELTDESLADWPYLRQILDLDMQNGLIDAENAELLSAVLGAANAGGDPNASRFSGLLNTSGILTRVYQVGTGAGGDNPIDTISRSEDDLRNGASFTEPDGIVMHPTNWGYLKRQKDSQGRYLLSPDQQSATDPRLHGLPVVLTTKMPVGTALVGAFAESTAAYLRAGIRIDATNGGAEQFKHNTTLVRAEERLSLTVPRPAGLVKLTALPS
jgi:HK97 family phage major capsid protein